MRLHSSTHKRTTLTFTFLLLKHKDIVLSNLYFMCAGEVAAVSNFFVASFLCLGRMSTEWPLLAAQERRGIYRK